MRWSAKSLFPAFGGADAATPPGADVTRAQLSPAASIASAPMALIGSGDESARAPFTPAAPVMQMATGPAPAPAVDAAAAEPAGPPRVLLAEDHPVNRKVVEMILASIGAEITSAVNGEEAVEAFRAARFDVVLMDMQMPVMDGLAATRAIRHLESVTGAAPTPILSLTANAMPEHVQASLEAGANAHLTKPVSAVGLIAAVRNAQAGLSAEPPLRRAG